MRRLRSELSKLMKTTEPIEVGGLIGVQMGGRMRIEVPNRDGFVYVRLRDNPSEFVQAYNNIIQNIYYDVPVTLRREGNRYVIVAKDSQRYSQWFAQDKSDGTGSNAQQIMLTRHGSSHSFDITSKYGGGDIAWIYSRQFTPGLVSPYNNSSPNLYISPFVVKNRDNEWKWVGNTGTSSIIQYKPDGGTRMVLVMIDTLTGNPYLHVDSGTFIPEGLTGTVQYLEYMPDLPSTTYMPLTLVRLESGTTGLNWDNLTDIREFGGGGTELSINGTGSVSNINFPDFSVLFSGTSAFVEYGANAGGGSDDSILFSVEGRLATGTNAANLYMFTEAAEIDEIYLYARTPGITGTTTVDINLIRSGTTSTIFTTQSNRPTLNFNDTDGWTFGTPNIKTFGAGDVLSLDIDTVAQNSADIVVAKLVTGTSSSTSGITVAELDGSPSISNVGTIKFDGAIVSDLGGGIAKVDARQTVVQVVNYSTGEVATGNTQIPIDDTIPQNTEGTEFMTLAITPTNASNYLKINTTLYIASNTAGRSIAAALFQDTNADALAAGVQYVGNDAVIITLDMTHYMVAGTTSSTTFKVRAGPGAAATITFNGFGGNRKFGGIMASQMTITEIKA